MKQETFRWIVLCLLFNLCADAAHSHWVKLLDWLAALLCTILMLHSAFKKS